jgi:hypothetical protein
MRMPRSCAMAAALIRLTASEFAKTPQMAALRMSSVLPWAIRPA